MNRAQRRNLKRTVAHAICWLRGHRWPPGGPYIAESEGVPIGHGQCPRCGVEWSASLTSEEQLAILEERVNPRDDDFIRDLDKAAR